MSVISKEVLSHPIFHNMQRQEILQMIHCFSFYSKTYQKDEYILMEGDLVPTIGLICFGTILIEKNDFHGNNYFFMQLKEHELFAEPFMGTSILNSSVNYKAMTPCEIVFFPYHTMWNFCSKNCRCHALFVENLTNLLALKTRRLLAKIEILSQKTLREKILMFLTVLDQYDNILSTTFFPTASNVTETSDDIICEKAISVPFNRTEMAEYLCVNRSSLVRELGNMEKDNILTIKKHIFYVHS